MFSFNDIFQSSFLERMNSVSLLDMIVALLLSFALGLFILFIYKQTYSGVMYSASFGVTLIALSMITTILILAVSSNVVLSLGMVGALSIVRFRAAIKEPSDIVYLFWSIAVGIVLAAGMIPLAVIGSIFIGIMLIIFASHSTFDQPYILVLHCKDHSSEKEANQVIEKNAKKYSLKSKTISTERIELNYEIRLKSGESDFINEINRIDGVTNTVMVSYNGDYMN